MGAQNVVLQSMSAAVFRQPFSAAHKKIDLSPLFHGIIHCQYYTSCIIAQPEPLTLVPSLRLRGFDLV